MYFVSTTLVKTTLCQINNNNNSYVFVDMYIYYVYIITTYYICYVTCVRFELVTLCG